MKNIIRFAFVSALMLVSAYSFGQEKKATWKELQDFHAVMSKSFHPTEDGDFKPLRENASLLVERAQQWRKSTVPAGFDAKQSAEVLDHLIMACTKINDAVKANAPDDQLKEMIVNAHDIFHELVEKCRKPEEGEKGHENGEHSDHK